MLYCKPIRTGRGTRNEEGLRSCGDCRKCWLPASTCRGISPRVFKSGKHRDIHRPRQRLCLVRFPPGFARCLRRRSRHRGARSPASQDRRSAEQTVPAGRRSALDERDRHGRSGVTGHQRKGVGLDDADREYADSCSRAGRRRARPGAGECSSLRSSPGARACGRAGARACGRACARARACACACARARACACACARAGPSTHDRRPCGRR